MEGRQSRAVSHGYDRHVSPDQLGVQRLLGGDIERASGLVEHHELRGVQEQPRKG